MKEAAFREILREGLAPWGLALTEDQEGLLIAYVEELILANQRMNLTAITDPEEVAVKHILDSLAAALAVELAEGMTLLDVGSGGGSAGDPVEDLPAGTDPHPHGGLPEEGRIPRGCMHAPFPGGLASSLEPGGGCGQGALAGKLRSGHGPGGGPAPCPGGVLPALGPGGRPVPRAEGTRRGGGSWKMGPGPSRSWGADQKRLSGSSCPGMRGSGCSSQSRRQASPRRNTRAGPASRRKGPSRPPPGRKNCPGRRTSYRSAAAPGMGPRGKGWMG